MNSRLDTKKTKKRVRQRQIKDVCAPHKENDTVTCFDKDTLIEMIKKYNKNHKKKIFPRMTLKELKKKTRKQLWDGLNEKFREACNDERCWRDTYFKNMKALDNDLKPVYPESWNSNKNEWLTTSNINNVCEQFEKKYPDFMFIGAVPIDFNDKISKSTCVVNELCKFRVDKFKQSKKHKLGVIFNLDPHYKDGSHWVALFADLQKGIIVYFDSYGYEPEQQIIDFITRLKQENEKLGVKTRVIKNTLRHQYKYSECGMYCIYFIKSMVEGKSYSIINNHIPDDKMEKLRAVFYYKPY